MAAEFIKVRANLWANGEITFSETPYRLIKETTNSYLIKNDENIYSNKNNRVSKDKLGKIKKESEGGKQPIKISTYTKKENLEKTKQKFIKHLKDRLVVDKNNKLYHISLDIYDSIEQFEPRTPKNRYKQEPKLPRICVGENLKGCFEAVPWGGFVLTHIKRYFDLIKHKEVEISGIPFVCYEFDASPLSDLEVINGQIFVPDGEITHEKWILKNIKPKAIKYGILENWKTQIGFLNSGKQVTSLEQCEYRFIEKSEAQTLLNKKRWTEFTKIANKKPIDVAGYVTGVENGMKSLSF